MIYFVDFFALFNVFCNEVTVPQQNHAASESEQHLRDAVQARAQKFLKGGRILYCWGISEIS